MNHPSHVLSIKKPALLAIALAVMALILAACQSKAASTATQVPVAAVPTATTAPKATPTAAVAEAVINVAVDPKLGSILVDGKGMTLYMFTKDEADKSNCNADCLAKWPPLLTLGSPKLGDGVDASLVGSTALADGSKIVTYNHMPLYYWVNDTKPGDTTGQDVGGVWYVVSPAGKFVMEATINVAVDPKLGSILVDGKGMTLYMFTKDEADKSNCNADCLAKWPPLLTLGSPKLGDGVDASLVGSAALADGSKIVTYNHMPLYYWVNDTKPGDTTGQDVGGVWYVVSPAGKFVMEATINVAVDPKLGSILVDGKGMTLYMFTKDEADKSNCNADCLAKWPPLLTQGTPKLGDGVDASLVGSAALADGSKIVTYNHMPLYYWVNDTKPGDTTGQNVGGVWYVVNPAGEVVMGAEATETPAPVSAEPTINVFKDPILGDILVDGKGMTLYMFTKDEANKSNCDADCLAKWPPLLTQGSTGLGDGVDGSLVGATALADGSMIVTYNKMPLYYWVNDTKPGDTTGQNVGGVWFVVNPAGEVVDKPGDVTINVFNDPVLGPILVDGNGMTLYMFTKDEADKSNCNADCLAKWPPFLTKGTPTLGEGVDDSKVGTTVLADGTLIVTYNHMPLYFWVNDIKAGDTTGQGVGSVWYVVDPDGDPVGR